MQHHAKTFWTTGCFRLCGNSLGMVSPSLYGALGKIWLRELSPAPPPFFGTTNTNTTKGHYTPGGVTSKKTRKCRVVRLTNNTWSAIDVLCCDIGSRLVVVLRCDVIDIHWKSTSLKKKNAFSPHNICVCKYSWQKQQETRPVAVHILLAMQCVLFL